MLHFETIYGEHKDGEKEKEEYLKIPMDKIESIDISRKKYDEIIEIKFDNKKEIKLIHNDPNGNNEGLKIREFVLSQRCK